MRLPRITELLALALFAIVVVVPFHRETSQVDSDHVFTVEMASNATGEFKLYFEDGRGLRESLARAVNVAAGNAPVAYRLPIPNGTLGSIRVDPINAPAHIVIRQARIVRTDGTTERTFSPEAFVPTHEIASAAVRGNELVIETSPGGVDPQLTLVLDPPLLPTTSGATPFGRSARRGLIAFAVGGLSWFFLVGASGAGRLRERIRTSAAAHPKRLVAALALVAAVGSSYPVVFLGRSFVSPNFADGTYLLYDRFPTLPGYDDKTTEQSSGSDVGAMAWQHGPISMVQHEALIEHGELPLWNRYNSAGTDLLGQGQMMLGDPLHLIVIAADGAAWAWDLKYVLARFIFAAALGLAVLAATGFAPGAWLTALSAPFIGFFLFRINHPAFFSLCYAPLVLLAWLRLTRAADARSTAPWLLLLVLANLMVMASGTAKEAYMLLISMNLAGLVLLVCSAQPWREKARQFAVLAAAGVLFVMLTAPLWVTFLEALRDSYTSYNAPSAMQIHPALVLGLFDEIFYRPIHAGNRVWNPSANILTLLGVLYVAATWRRVPPDRTKLALALACVPPALLAFGGIPPSWIVQIPFLANVGHIDNSFSCPLIILLILLAGFGWRSAAERLGTDEARGDLTVCALLAAGMLLAWLATTQVLHREPFGGNTVLQVTHHGPWGFTDPFILANIGALLGASIVAVWIARRSLRRGSWTPAGVVVAFTCLTVLLWRFGAHGTTRFDNFVFNPAVRVDFHASSPAIDYIRSHQAEPSRVTGLESVLMPGWSIAYRLEGINGPDALMNQAYRELITAMGIERIWDWRLYISPESVPGHMRAFDMLNIRYLLADHRPANVSESILPTRLSADLVVMENPTAWPRAFFTDRMAVAPDPATLVRLARESDGRPLAAADPATATTAGLPEALADRTTVAARDYRLTPNTTTFTIDAPTRGVVVLHETWQRGNFRTSINGRRAKWLRVNHAFKGVIIEEPGTHVISFEFWPRHLTLALGACALGAGGLVGLWFLLRRSPRATTT